MFKINKKVLIIPLVLILLFSIVVYAAKPTLPERAAKGQAKAQAAQEKFCEIGDIEKSLKKILYLYITEPKSVPLTLDEIKDLLGFYLNIEEGKTTERCSITVLGSISKRPILDMVNVGRDLPDKIPTCSDGTQYGKCSVSKPLHCTARGVVDRCQKCGCPSGSVCSNSTGKCVAADKTVICSTDLDCGTSNFAGDYYCSNDYITKNYINYTCENPGTTDSRCIVSNASTTLEYCDPASNKICVDGSCKLKIQIIQITTDPADQYYPDIYENKIVWQDYTRVDVYGNYKTDIYMYDISTGKETQITTGTPINEDPAIYGDKIAWTTDPLSGIHMYDIPTGQESPLIIAKTREQAGPAIYKNKIVWADARNGYGNWDIYMYDLSTGQETQMTTNPANQWEPAIYENKIVWEDRRNGDGNQDIYMYDISTGKEIQITTDQSYQQTPSIHGDKIVWVDSRNGNSDIYMYDTSTDKETQITSTQEFEEYPDIYGDKIAWESYNPIDRTSGIYMYDLVTAQATQLTVGSEPYNAAIYGNRIVWNDYRNGNYDIYMAVIS